eukprot:GDKI01029956.1.p2 GENE.GDKI01029956.1~~GDKI01029956.1.p2  ORF type:complete len:173 (-),score=75.88 GDKI01029956.1:290-769(-)
MDQDSAILAARAKLAQRIGATQTGGKGCPRRKKRVVHKATATDDKKVQATLKRLGANVIPGIEEVNMFREDGSIIHFTNPKVQASIQSNTFAVSGNGETKALTDLLPGIISQMGPENMNNLRALFQQAGMGRPGAPGAEGDDDDVPDLVDNFEQVSKKK